LSFHDNALIKARAAFMQTGLPSIADDSGITVRALGGAPGIYSQRYSPSGTDRDNTELLLATMTGETDRFAAFVCAAALVYDGGEKVIERSWQGSLATAERGSKGFGYDPLFIPEGLEVTSAELSPEEKDELSHRGQALKDLARFISGVLG
jgi:XTP/dITP diphosphohydrolase